MKVYDPNENLSHQVLALDQSTGRGFILEPEDFVIPLVQKDFPNGVYTLLVKGKTDPRNWYFVAADNKCYNSPVMKHPFGARDYLAARPQGDSTQMTTQKMGEGSGLEGRKVFQANCSMCHLADSTQTKVGPGLKGLFQAKRMPVSGEPVNRETVRQLIQGGGKKMPLYGHIKGQKMNALLEYLKTL